jgi:hypothetical protein
VTKALAALAIARSLQLREVARQRYPNIILGLKHIRASSEFEQSNGF